MAKKKPKPALWVGYETVEQMRQMQMFQAAFGQVTTITEETFYRPWRRVPGASSDRCPECMSWWEQERWPACGFCRYRDPAGKVVVRV